MLEITIMGSSSGDPSPLRANASFVLRTGKNIYQFDAGEGFSASAKRLKIDYNNICAVFITHMHPDHITGLFLEIQMMFLSERRDPLPVYVPSEAVEPVRQFMQATYLFEDKLGFEIPIRPVTPDPVFRDPYIAVYARANSHLNKYQSMVEKYSAPNRMQSYSYVIKTDEKKILYSGDIGETADYADLLSGTDLLITEGMHVDLESLFSEVAANNVSHLILTHLSEEAYRNSGPIKASARKLGVPNLIIAEDGLSLKL